MSASNWQILRFFFVVFEMVINERGLPHITHHCESGIAASGLSPLPARR
jgi:hypothetical protein